MVRRSARTAFMPHTWVFPGGRVDPEDGAPGSLSAFDRAARREVEEEAGLVLDHDAHPLRWFDTWKTPSAESRRRYLARFFIATIDDDDHAESASHDGEESIDGRWASAEAFLSEWSRGECDLPPPTLAILGRLASDGVSAMLTRDLADLDTPILPRIGSHEGSLAVLLPHDAEYAAGIGEAGPCPVRASEYPTRFARRDDRWIPID
jgi:8-oxo-dGTP pyrophosphatase MutT (NUDIX family)